MMIRMFCRAYDTQFIKVPNNSSGLSNFYVRAVGSRDALAAYVDTVQFDRLHLEHLNDILFWQVSSSCAEVGLSALIAHMP